MEQEVFICDCKSPEHQIVFSYYEDEVNSDDIMMYAEIHLKKLSFSKRLKYAIKYIFGYQSKYGAFDCFIFKKEDAYKLQKLATVLKGK